MTTQVLGSEGNDGSPTVGIRTTTPPSSTARSDGVTSVATVTPMITAIGARTFVTHIVGIEIDLTGRRKTNIDLCLRRTVVWTDSDLRDLRAAGGQSCTQCALISRRNSSNTHDHHAPSAVRSSRRRIQQKATVTLVGAQWWKWWG